MTINELSQTAHQNSKDAGWYTNIETGEPLDRNIPEMICLMHSELSEALEAYRKNLQDDKLPHRSGIEVELADTMIRIADLAGYLNLDLENTIKEKMEYNQSRQDHKLSFRQSDPNGKRC